ARPGVHRAFLAVSTAVVLSAGAVTSWAAQAGHDHPAGAPHGHDASGQLAAAVDGSHSHTEGSAVEPGTGAADPHTHAEGGEHAATADADAAGTSHAGHTATSVVHDHVVDGREQVAAPVSGAHRHDSTAAAGGRPDETAQRHETAPTAQPGDHQHGSPGAQFPAAPAGADAPQGTWAELRYGPFVVTPAGAGGDADHANIAVPSLSKPCSNCFLLEFQPDLVYADGTSANLDTGVMLHHAVLFSAGRQDPTCGPEQPFPGKLGQRFFASGNERTGGQFPPGFGYFVDGGNWSGIFHVMNHSAEAKSVFFQLKVRWSPAAAGGVHPLTPIWLDMNNCRTSEYAVPPGPSSSHWTWASNLTGRIVATAGHVHDGGVRTTLTNQTTGQHLCTSWAGWGKNPAYKGSIRVDERLHVGPGRDGAEGRGPRPRIGLRLPEVRPRRHGDHDGLRLRDQRPRRRHPGPTRRPGPEPAAGRVDPAAFGTRPPLTRPPTGVRLPEQSGKGTPVHERGGRFAALAGYPPLRGRALPQSGGRCGPPPHHHHEMIAAPHSWPSSSCRSWGRAWRPVRSVSSTVQTDNPRPWSSTPTCWSLPAAPPSV
ncbi:MAG TPA: hypothetical protein VG034_29095, partial [Acidimicrobiia bacterium]|nr:hypothetical protein [Acidimicrobiia bacterium]